MQSKTKELFIAAAIPLAVGGLSALLSMEGMKAFDQVAKPAFTPPSIVFPIVWTLLYLFMGTASWLIWRQIKARPKNRAAGSGALKVYALQLIVNFFWSILFFRLGWYLPAFWWLVLLWLLVLAALIRFYRLSPAAGLLLVPYLLWVSFAGYLNLGVALLNP